MQNGCACTSAVVVKIARIELPDLGLCLSTTNHVISMYYHTDKSFRSREHEHTPHGVFSGAGEWPFSSLDRLSPADSND